MRKTALIMAGGRGERFWPKSRERMPKQFLSLTNDTRTMIQLTVERILPLVEIGDIFIATNRQYRQIIREQLPDLPEENILCEPVGRNTAPCIGLGAVHIAHKYEDAVMFVLPSDHLITHPQLFRRTLKEAARIVTEGEKLVTIGIAPVYAETGYGYIQFDENELVGSAYRVERFVEKPDFRTAQQYVASQKYLWNSGMFIWRVSTILNNLKEYMPETYSGLQKIGKVIGTPDETAVLDREYQAFQSESIDCGVMENAKEIYTLTGEFGWDDVGSWLALERLKVQDENRNVLDGNVVSIDTRNTIIQGGNKLIATVGVEDLVIIDTEDALLICDKDSTGNIKKLVEKLKQEKRTEYL